MVKISDQIIGYFNFPSRFSRKMGGKTSDSNGEPLCFKPVSMEMYTWAILLTYKTPITYILLILNNNGHYYDHFRKFSHRFLLRAYE